MNAGATSLLVVSIGFAFAAAAETKPATAKGPAMKMDPFVVNGESTLSFGFGVKLYKDNLGQKTMALFVTDVDPDSEAAHLGIRPAMQIIAIDGKATTDYEPTFRPGSVLRAKFIGREKHAQIALDVVDLTAAKPKHIVLTGRGLTIEAQKNRNGWVSPFGSLDDDLWSHPMSKDR